MKKALIIGGLIIVSLLGLWLILPNNDCEAGTCATETTNQQPLPKIAVTEAEQGQAYLFDVRTPDEFNSGHAQQAINFDVELLKSGQLPDANKDAKIYVYCRSGNRSAQASEILTTNGYTNVTDLGGLENMRAAGVL